MLDQNHHDWSRESPDYHGPVDLYIHPLKTPCQIEVFTWTAVWRICLPFAAFNASNNKHWIGTTTTSHQTTCYICYVEAKQLTVVTAGQSFPILEDMVNSSVNYYTIHGLEPGINYEISVSTITDEAESVPSVITQQTQTGELSHIGLLHFGGWE